MRRLLALGCCAVYLAFGFVAGAAHVHESADHHEETRGLHLDHAHLGEIDDHDHAHHDGHGHTQRGDVWSDARHIGHHDGDALYLTATAVRSFDTGSRALPATACVGATIDPPSAAPVRDAWVLDRPRDPPRESRTRPRAPPA